MTIRNLDRAFRPDAIALIGASQQNRSVGAVVARNLFGGGFDGPVMPVNPHARSVASALAYPDIASLPVTPDLGVVCTPAPTVPGIIDDLGRRGAKAAIVVTAGFAELGPEGRRLQEQVLQAARPHLLRVIGPNCLGVIVPGCGLNASFAHMMPQPGHLAFVTQSGAIMTSVLDWAAGRGLGFSHLVSLGGMADVDFGDMLDYLANEPQTRAILLYVEAITHARKFLSAARAAARVKPVVVIKAGRHAEGARAAASHTGALAGSDAVYDAAFRRAGMLRVRDIDEVFNAAETLGTNVPLRGDRLAILTNGGGMGVLATDRLIDEGGHLAELAPQTLAALDKILPPTWSKANPIDIIGDAPGARYRHALDILFTDPGIDAILVMNCPTAIADSVEAAEAVIATIEEASLKAPHPSGRPAVLTSWLGGPRAIEARRLFAARRLPTYTTPDQAVQALMHLVRHRRSQDLLMETPAAVDEALAIDGAAARAVLDQARAAGREWLSEPEAKAVLAAYGLPVVPTRRAADPEDAARIAAEIGFPVALKILSPDITHKTDVGGVALDLPDAAAVRDAAARMSARVRAERPEARLDGFTVQPMLRTGGAYELILGMTEDAVFGPVVLFGQGGTAVELIRDQALGLPPLNTTLAHDLIGRTRIARLLGDMRGQKGIDRDALALALVRLSQMVIDLPEMVELDINPLLASPDGLMALDARLRLRATGAAPGPGLAIRPYPRALESRARLPSGEEVFIRPVRPEDEPLLHAMIAHVTPEDMRLRFFAAMKRLPRQLAARLTQIDYDREMALVALMPPEGPERAMVGVVRISADPDNERAEYAVLVRSDLKGHGLGWLLMTRILDYARARGIEEVFGQVLRENRTMLHLCRELGFAERSLPEEPGIVEVSIRLADLAAREAV